MIMKTNVLTAATLAAAILAGCTRGTQENVITFTTDKGVGLEIFLGIDAAEEHRADIWIDLNNNGVKDKGETVTNFGKNSAAEYVLEAQTVTIHGNVSVLWCDYVELNTLDVSKNKYLSELNCSDNLLTELDLSKNSELTVLYCPKNELTKLDVSNNQMLTYLNCSDNHLSKLDVSNNLNLNELHCDANQISKLDISQNSALKIIDCTNNQFSESAIANIVDNLPLYTSSDNAKAHFGGNLALPTPQQVTKAEKKGWDIIEPQIILTTLKASGEQFKIWVAADEIDRANVWIDLNNNGAKEDGEYFETLDRAHGHKETFEVQSQKITVYGKITFLACSENEIMSLTVRKGEKLHELSCNKNQINSVNLAEAPMLKDLWLNNNQLTEEEISKIVADLPTRDPSDYAKAYFDDNLGRATKQDSALAASKNWRISPVKLSPEAQAKYDALLKDWKPFLGKWCCNDETVREGECFQLEFSLYDNGLSISYYSGGPFEENFTGKVISDNHAELYFASIGGSTSFNRAKGDMDGCVGQKVADCMLQPDGTLTIVVGDDKCGAMDGTHTLRKLKESEWCELRYN